MSLPTIVTRDTKKVFTYRNTKFWAERGFINMVAEDKDGEHTKIALPEWVTRMRAFRAQWEHMQKIDWTWKDEYRELTGLIQDMGRAALQAKAQGDITCAADAAYIETHIPRNQVSMAQAAPTLILPSSYGDSS